MFNAPDIFTNIPDIAQMYDINEKQCEALDQAIEEMNANIFLDSMGESMIERWEEMLKISPLDNDSLEDRRFRVKSKVMERLPYSIRVIWQKLDTLCPGGYAMTVSEDRTEVSIKLALTSIKMIEDVGELMEEMLPLNMVFTIEIMFNQYKALSKYTYAELAEFTHGELRESTE